MVLKALEDAIPFFLALDTAAGIVAVEFSIFGDISCGAEVLFVPHDFFDAGLECLFVFADQFESPLCRVVYLRLLLSFIV